VEDNFIWLCPSKNYNYFWFTTFVVLWMLYSFFWVFPRRLNFICRRFGTLSLSRSNRVFRNVGTCNSDAGESPKRRIQQELWFLCDTVPLCLLYQSRIIFYYPANTTIKILYIWLLFHTATCFGCSHQPSPSTRYWFTKIWKWTGLSL